MPVIDFPSSPSNNELFIAQGKAMRYNSDKNKWRQVTTLTSNQITELEGKTIGISSMSISGNTLVIQKDDSTHANVSLSAFAGNILTNYASASQLPTTGLVAGSQVYVTDTDCLYITDGSGWYKIATVNLSPSLSLGVSSISLGAGGSVDINYTITEPEDTPFTITASATSSASITVHQANNTITFDNPTVATSETITISATDGVNTVADTLTMSITLGPDWSTGGNYKIAMDGSYIILGTGLLPSNRIYTAEAWIQPNEFGLQNRVFSQYSGDTGRTIHGIQNDVVSSFIGGDGSWHNTSTQVFDDIAHFVWVSNGDGTISMWKNGIFAGTATQGGSSSPPSGATTRIGNAVDMIVYGFRLNSNALYTGTGNFTPPALDGGLTNVAGTIALWDGKSSTLTDASGNQGTFTVSGGGTAVVIQNNIRDILNGADANKTVTGVRKYGYGVEMDGANNRLAVADPSANYGLGLVDIYELENERWVYKQSIHGPPEGEGAGGAPSNDSQLFGQDISLRGDYLAVGAPYADEGTWSTYGEFPGQAYTGAVYVFKRGVQVNFATGTVDHASPRANGQNGQPYEIMNAMLLNSNGTKMFMIGDRYDKLYTYDLGTAYDVSSAVYNTSADIDLTDMTALGNVNPVAMRWNNDGTKLFILNQIFDRLHEYSTSSPYEIASMTHNGHHQFLTTSLNSRGFDFNNDGTKIVVVDVAGDKVFSYNLTSAYDYSTISVEQLTLTLTYSGTVDPYGIAFNSTGTKMFINNQDTPGSVASIKSFDLTTAYDISTASFVSSTPVTSGTLNTSGEYMPRQITFGPDYTKAYLVGNALQRVTRLDVGQLSWSLQQKIKRVDLSHSKRFDNLGTQVHLMDDNGTGLICYNQHNFNSSYTGSSGDAAKGQIHYVTRSGTTWSEATPLGSSNAFRPTNHHDLTSQRWGTRLDGDANGDRIITSSYRSGGMGTPTNSGRVFIFTRSGSTFTEEVELAEPTPTLNSRFGSSVSINAAGDECAIAAHGATVGSTTRVGAVYVYTRSGSTWTLQQKVHMSGTPLAETNFGGKDDDGSPLSQMRLVGDYLYVTAEKDDSQFTDAGALYVFKRSGTTWTQQAKIYASNGLGSPYHLEQTLGAIGASESHPNYVVVGSPAAKGFDGTNATKGKVFVFKADD